MSSNFNNASPKLKKTGGYSFEEKSMQNTDNGEEASYFKTQRDGRKPVVYSKPIKMNFDKLMIPYDFVNNRYYIKESEINEYEGAEYILKKLRAFEDNDLFNFDKKFNPSGCFMTFLFEYLPIGLVYLVFFYITLLIAVYTFFNIGLLFMCYIFGRKLNNYIKIMKYSLWDKYKIRKIKGVLNIENISVECIKRRLNWSLGQSGYWLEIKKLVD